MKKPRTQIEPTLKLEIVHMVTEQGLSVTQVSQNMNVGETAIRRWIKQYQEGNLAKTKPQLSTEQLRIRQLEKENAQLKSDVEVLKKASAFFARLQR